LLRKIVTPIAAPRSGFARSLTPSLGARAEGETSFIQEVIMVQTNHHPDTTATTRAFTEAFAETVGQFRITTAQDLVDAGMPDADEARHATELLVVTLFDVLRDTRLEPIAERLAWGMVHAFHRVASQLDDEADRAAGKVKDLVRQNDGSEIAAGQLEEAQTLCQSLDEARDAVACMRDHAAATFHTETGRPWSSPRATLVSSKRTASVIAATDFLAARRQRKIAERTPDGPIVLFSGGAQWHDHELIYRELDRVRALVPHMVLATTGQGTGCDAIAAAWAARTGVTLIPFDLDRRLGKRAGFARNETMARLRPVDALVCEGSGLQAHLVRTLRSAGMTPRLLQLADQRVSVSA
jgi:hypothetical protein